MRQDPLTFVRPAFLRVIVAVSVATILLFPVYMIFVQYPAFVHLLQQITLNEATGTVRYLSSLLEMGDAELGRGALTTETVRQIRRVQDDSRFIQLRIFSPEGEILYSKDQAEIGTVNRGRYFRDIVAGRKSVVEEVRSPGTSLEKEAISSDLIEAYVPILRQGALVGVFEVSYDVTEVKRRLKGLVDTSSFILSGMAAVLLAGVLLSAGGAARYLNDRQRMVEELRTLSLSDELTGLYNRRGFFVLAEQQMRIAVRSGGGLILLSVDLDGLKTINDGFGHHEGDRAIVDTAQVLRETFRGSDILARIGGDEFVVLVIEKPGTDKANLQARLQRNLDAYRQKFTRPYNFSMSCGSARFDPEKPATLNELLVQADRAMYRDKLRRKGTLPR